MNRQTQMIADLVAEKNIPIEGLNAEEIEQEVRIYLALSCFISSGVLSDILEEVKWEELTDTANMDKALFDMIGEAEEWDDYEYKDDEEVSNDDENCWVEYLPPTD